MSLKRAILSLCVLPLIAVSLLGGCAGQRAAAPFGADACINRQSASFTPLVDSHVHFRPFGGPTLEFEDMVDYLEDAGIRYALVYGIGQMLPLDSDCYYYLECPGVPVTPTLKNDFLNASEYVRTRPHNVHLTLSMTFPDLADPEAVLEGISVLDREFPGVFGMMGEVNLVKQALFDNHHAPVSIETIADWAPFMKILRERGMPMAIHADLGSNLEPVKYRPWIEEVLRRYPDNKIVWMHLGLSREQRQIDPQLHIGIMRDWLDTYPNLMMDLSWRVLHEAIFTSAAKREQYLPFLHEYSRRFLAGTDFVATGASTAAQYYNELKITSGIFRYLDDAAYTDIALGGNYLRLLGLDHEPPKLCQPGG